MNRRGPRSSGLKAGVVDDEVHVGVEAAARPTRRSARTLPEIREQ